MGEARGRLFVPGRNCWRIERAHRVAFLIDAAAYFAAVHAFASDPEVPPIMQEAGHKGRPQVTEVVGRFDA